MGASPGCWAAYGEVLAREYGTYRYPPIHLVTVHAYAAQHPGADEEGTRRTLALHLLGLFLFCERGVAPEATVRALQRMGDRTFPVLSPPDFRGALTVLEVRGATSIEAHVQCVERWARSVWDAWAARHPAVRSWIGGEVDG